MTSLGWKITPHEEALGHNHESKFLVLSLPSIMASLSTYCMQTIRDRVRVLMTHTQVPPCRLHRAPTGMCMRLGTRKHPEYGVSGSQSCYDMDTLIQYPW